jgi:hypothetical protein
VVSAFAMVRGISFNAAIAEVVRSASAAGLAAGAGDESIVEGGLMYAWASRDRLCSPRMVWLHPSYSFPRHERQRLRHRPLRAATRLDEDRGSRVEDSLWARQRYAGRLGEWPGWRPDRHRRR